MELTYTKIGDYFYPDLTLPETNDDRPMGKYGMMRKTYLKQYHPMVYDRLLLVGMLDAHLREIDDLATEQVNRMVADMVAKEGIDEQLKAADQMRWVGLMNSFRASAEEVVLREIVYTA
nr:TnpV protein [uncultured Agathobaculum sp.]